MRVKTFLTTLMVSAMFLFQLPAQAGDPVDSRG